MAKPEPNKAENEPTPDDDDKVAKLPTPKAVPAGDDDSADDNADDNADDKVTDLPTSEAVPAATAEELDRRFRPKTWEAI